MAIRTVRYLGEDILRKKCKKIEVVDDKTRELLDDMLETMRKYDGIGLAAPQIGILKQLVVIDVPEVTKEPIKLINPVIVSKKGEQVAEEGCLSIPNKFAQVKRPAEVVVEALNENGEEVTITAKEIMAVVLSHEIDHLDGVVFTDKMIPGTLETVEPEEDTPKNKRK